jgi:hypothetical protein
VSREAISVFFRVASGIFVDDLSLRIDDNFMPDSIAHANRLPGKQMKRIVILLLLMLAGCGNFYLDTSDLLRTQNAENIKKLTVGMRKDVVMEMMGTEPSKGVFMWIDNPYRTETLTGRDGKTYEVLYYYSQLKQRDDKITDDELTPLVFQDGKLIGWGYPFLDQKVPPKPVYTR